MCFLKRKENDMAQEEKMSVQERTSQVLEKFGEKLDTKLEFDETIDVNSREELIEKYNKYIEENFKRIKLSTTHKLKTYGLAIKP